MRQRQSLRFPQRPPSIPTEKERLDQSIAIAKYLLTEDRCLTPTLFFNVEEFGQTVLSGNFENESIVLRPQEEEENVNDPMLAVNTLTLLTSSNDAAALIINFDICNTVVIAGSSEQYYFVDLFHDICYVTKSPEYDIMSYVAEYGESDFKAYYYGSVDNVNFRAPEPAAAAEVVTSKKREPTAELTAPPPAQKKKKPAANPKKAATAAAAAPPPPPMPVTTETI